MPGAGGTQRMARLICAAKTKEMVLLGRKIKGSEAGELGLATVVVPDEQVQEESLKMAEELKEMPAYACAMAKRAINLGETYGIGTGKLFEKELFGLCFAHPDQEEGMDAFMNKRTPHYSNDR